MVQIKEEIKQEFSVDLGNKVQLPVFWKRTSLRLPMLWIPGGTFMMGSPETERDRAAREGPQHEVTVPGFYIGKYPITQAQWQKIAANVAKVERELNPKPASFRGSDRPVEQVSWDDAVEFCARLTQHTEREYRLPTEAEWEYACRAGTATPFHFGETITTDLANYNGNYTYGDAPKGKCRWQTTRVGHFSANAYGLHDMHGNVWEWCQDDWHETYEGAPTDGTAWLSGRSQQIKLMRGGSWTGNPWHCRSAFRYHITRGNRYFGTGFRVACGGLRT